MWTDQKGYKIRNDNDDSLLEQLWANYSPTNAFMRPTKASMKGYIY